ncbi:MAG TPA: TfoX/Sxy family protein [Gemmatimonadaceae bacterium]
MAFDEKLAVRIRNQLGRKKGVTEKKMFGGIAFLLNGNMSCGVHGEEMIVRLATDETDAALAQKHTRVFDLSGGRPMKGWILVEPDGLRTDKALAKWVETGVSYAASLPPK